MKDVHLLCMHDSLNTDTGAFQTLASYNAHSMRGRGLLFRSRASAELRVLLGFAAAALFGEVECR